MPHWFRSFSNPLRALVCLKWMACACVLLLFVCGITARPTGYLHSWNQISALTVIRQIHEDPHSFLRPTGVITRVTTPVTPGESIDDRFLNFQEFPLYHGLAALVAFLGLSFEVSGHFVSIIFWAIQWIALKQLVRDRSPLERHSIDLVYLTSFAVTYYGQAIMSDIAMAAVGAWAIERAVSCRERGNVSAMYAAIVCVGISGLFKSYGLIFALPVLILVWPRLISWKVRSGVLISVLVISLPVVWWHTYAMLQGGYNEISSHGLANKLSALVDTRLYKSMWRDYTHFVGIIAGVIALVSAVLFRFGMHGSVQVPAWVAAWMVALVPYSVATLDKLPDHEYYILPFALPLVVLVGVLVARMVSLCADRMVCTALIFTLAVGQMVISYRSVVKAQRENPDVVACADILRQVTEGNELVAFASDTQRYNSLAYYAERRGFHVEGSAFPSQRYLKEGARVFLLAHDSDGQGEARAWLRKESKGDFTLVVGSKALYDFRGKSRICQVFRARSSAQQGGL